MKEMCTGTWNSKEKDLSMNEVIQLFILKKYIKIPKSGGEVGGGGATVFCLYYVRPYEG
jgi:hypothetical protein